MFNLIDGTTMSGVRIFPISLEALSYDQVCGAISHSGNTHISPETFIAVPFVTGKPLPCQANSEACSAISEGLAFLLYAM
ncbi:MULTISPECIES: hypothetical protein [Pseudomonas]|uniref:Uncharacterized protein n=1 Tax=Pseudomonas fluorescens TaxID=294 RepID=A0A165YNY6_PSEFL|nr:MULTISPECIES: hypothetical protein [Pseudomonas]AMZ69771.1 hypothetical protein TK06_01210 [Pseudomonas fluorescens]